MAELNVDDVFRMREPPPGGLTRLRARLDEVDRGARVLRVAWAATGLAGIALLMLAPSPETAHLESSPGLVRLGSAERPDDPVVSADQALAVLEVERTPRVVYYRVASLGSISEPPR